MTLYFDYRVDLGELVPNCSFTCLEWHPQHPLLAVGVFSQLKGGAVYLCDELGEKLKDVDPTVEPSSEVSCLSWHPSRRTLVVAWKSGELRIWSGEADYSLAPTTKTAAILTAKWSQQGSRLFTIDSDGEVGGWRLDARGQLVCLFTLPPATAGAEPGGGDRAVCLEPRLASRGGRRPGGGGGDGGSPGGLDLAGLAKRAVAGDERALDIFSAWRPRTAGRRTAITADPTAFFFATESGRVYYVNESGAKQEVLGGGGGRVLALLHHQNQDYLLLVAESLHITYYSIDAAGFLHEVSQVKLSSTWSSREETPGGSEDRLLTWAGPGLLASAVGDLTVRFWEPASGDSYSINMAVSEGPPLVHKEAIVALAFSKNKGLLCGCTNAGLIAIWKGSGGGGYEGWSQVASTRVKQAVTQAAWGFDQLAINTSSTVYILKEQPLSAVYHEGMSVIQTSATQMVVTKEEGGETAELNTDLQALGISLYREVLAVWSGKVMAVYQLSPLSSISVIGSWECDCGRGAGLWEQTVAVLSSSGRLSLLTLQGSPRQVLETGGQPITLSLTGHFLTTATITGILQLWDISRREAKPHSKVKDLIESIPDFGEVISAVCNCNATKVALTIANSNLTPCPAVFVWSLDLDTIQPYFFNREGDPLRFVTCMTWDSSEPQLLACEARRPAGATSTAAGATGGHSPGYSHSAAGARLRRTSPQSQPTTLLVSFLCSGEEGLLLRDSAGVGEGMVSLLALSLPHFIVVTKSTSQQKLTISHIVMKDFEGLEDCDTATKNAVVSFSFSLSIGNIDQAFNSIRSIKSGAAIWRSLGGMCVACSRLDVGKVCLGKMGDSKGVALLTQAEASGEEEPVRLALLALRLGITEEAEKLYLGCERYDLLNQLYQKCGLWDKAIEVAQKYDRIHLKNTYHLYAKYLEMEGDMDSASHMYFRADTHRHEVPRMLLYNSPALEKYILNSKDPVLLKWWAQYMESTGQMEPALRYYEEAGDTLSLVRLLSYMKDTERATLLAERSGHKAACNHLARTLELLGDLPQAVHFYTRATAYHNAIRLCKEQGLDDELWRVGLSAGAREQAEAARHLELSSPARAVVLYQRAGLLHRALDLAFRHNLYEAVEQIATELTAENEKELLTRCAQFFIDQHHYEKAVHLLAIAKEYERALKDCIEQNVLVTEELAEALTPPEAHPRRVGLLELLADTALAQANYHLATKKYTQAGNKMKAMKALLKSGDTEKIIFFANVSRQREMYVLAANYLQSLDWRTQPELLKNIIAFYTKGKAPHLLANFYISCAQVEVDDYRNYTKALGALNEAAKTLANTDQYSNIKETINRKTALVNKFLDATRQFERGERDAGLETCRGLLAAVAAGSDGGGGGAGGELVKRGDVYALMVENCVRTGDLATAKQLVTQLRSSLRNESLDFYITKDILKKLGMESVLNEIEKEKNLKEVEDEVIDETI